MSYVTCYFRGIKLIVTLPILIVYHRRLKAKAEKFKVCLDDCEKIDGINQMG